MSNRSAPPFSKRKRNLLEGHFKIEQGTEFRDGSSSGRGHFSNCALEFNRCSILMRMCFVKPVNFKKIFLSLDIRINQFWTPWLTSYLDGPATKYCPAFNLKTVLEQKLFLFTNMLIFAERIFSDFNFNFFECDWGKMLFSSKKACLKSGETSNICRSSKA